MAQKDIAMVKGNTLAFTFRFKNLDQALDSAYFTCKVDPLDAEPAFQKDLSDGIESIGEGVYKVRVAPEDTAELTAGRYCYDLQLGVNNDKFTPLYGALILIQNVTD